ncbi:hypothetical protein ABIA95_000169 [Bradyrhizobium sp. LA8.1]
MDVEFPRVLLRERSHAWNLAGVAVAGGQLGSGFGTFVRSDGGGFWTCSMSNISLSGRNGIDDRGRQRQANSTKLWRAVRQVADGGVNRMVVWRNDALFVPWPDGAARLPPAIPHDDGSLFSDDTGYYQPVIDVTCDAADLRATSLDINLNRSGDLIGGEAFSIRHDDAGWRIYEIATVEMTGDDTATITFNPPLREDVADDTQLEFDRPRCVMRLTQPSSMNLTVQPWTFNSANVDFVEAPVS